MTATIEGDQITVTEQLRIYQFPNGEVELHEPREIIIRPSGSHRVITADGALHHITGGWLAIHIVDPTTEGWTA